MSRTTVPPEPIAFPLRAKQLGFFLFFLMLVVPTSYPALKAGLLATLLVMIAVHAFTSGRLALHRRVAALTFLFIVTGLFFVVLGAVNGNAGALRSATVFVIWPAIYLLFVSHITSEREVEAVMRTLVLATLAVELYTIDYLLYATGWIPGWLYLPLDLGQNVGFYEGFIEFTLYSTSSLLFLVPFALSMSIAWPRGEHLPGGRRLIAAVSILGLGLVILSGRRGLLIAVAASVVVIYLLRRRLPANRRRRSRPLMAAVTSVALIGFLFVAFDVRPAAVVQSLAEGFQFAGGTESAEARGQQFDALIDGWQASPLLGVGLGGVAKEIVRDPEMPWAYELAYVSLLFHVGVVGLLLYGAGVAWIFAHGIRMIRRGDRLGLCMLATLAGMASFLIGNATNPYLEKFDYLWVIFLPVALINFSLLTRPQARHNS